MRVRSSRSLARPRATRAFMTCASAFSIDGALRAKSGTSSPGCASANDSADCLPRDVSIHTRARASLSACSAALTSSSYSAGSTRMNVSFAASDPPFLNSGETRTTRPTTSEATRTLLSIRTDPVSSTVRAGSTGTGRTTLTAGLALSSVRGPTRPPAPRARAPVRSRARPRSRRVSGQAGRNRTNEAGGPWPRTHSPAATSRFPAAVVGWSKMHLQFGTRHLSKSSS